MSISTLLSGSSFNIPLFFAIKFKERFHITIFKVWIIKVSLKVSIEFSRYKVFTSPGTNIFQLISMKKKNILFLLILPIKIFHSDSIRCKESGPFTIITNFKAIVGSIPFSYNRFHILH